VYSSAHNLDYFQRLPSKFSQVRHPLCSALLHPIIVVHMPIPMKSAIHVRRTSSKVQNRTNSSPCSVLTRRADTLDCQMMATLLMYTSLKRCLPPTYQHPSHTTCRLHQLDNSSGSAVQTDSTSTTRQKNIHIIVNAELSASHARVTFLLLHK